MNQKKLRIKTSEEAINVLGVQDANIKQLEKKLRVSIFTRQSKDGSINITVRGSKSNADKAINYLNKSLNDFRKGISLDSAQAKRHAFESAKLPPKALYQTAGGEFILPRGKRQEKYINYILSNDLTISVGPAGTGKTFLAAACALRHLNDGKIKKIILTRPIVEAGEKLGFLPGNIYDKVHPYLRPLYDAFFTLLGPDKFGAFRAENIIEIVPLAYMRGRTLENSFIILDEAQNTMPEQMKMFLTRMGIFSKMVITGDITQIDLERKSDSGLVIVSEILKNLKSVKFMSFTSQDIVRHHLVKEIINAYDAWEKTEDKEKIR